MIGFSFTASSSTRRILDPIFSLDCFAHYQWHIDDYMHLIGQCVLHDGVYTTEALRLELAKFSEEDVSDNFCIFGHPDSISEMMPLPKVTQEYLKSRYTVIITCVDARWFDIYCKNPEHLGMIRNAIVAHAICETNAITDFSLETDPRTGF